MPRKPLRLVHTSDVHLEMDIFGSGGRGDILRGKLRRAFAKVIDVANDRAADLLLVVGDLFDSNCVNSEALAFAFETISKARMSVVIVPGNHDPHGERSIYASLSPAALPGNLHLILDPEGQTLHFPSLEARVWGRALVEHSPEYRPLAGIPQPDPEMWNIALAHGLFVDGQDLERSSPITGADIEQSGYHYVALGHVHIFGDVSQGGTRALYCGTPVALYAGDDSGSVLMVDCVPEQPVNIQKLPIEP